VATPIFLDTDIGDDIDDAYALALILASPELELRGISTVFGNTVARARQARTLLKLAGRPEIPVAAGCGGVMSPRIDYGSGPVDVDGRLVPIPFADAILDVRPNQDATSLADEHLPPADRRSGVGLMIETILAGHGDVVPVTIGAMTNLAAALIAEPAIIRRIPRVVAMAGAFSRDQSEWNIRCDPVAAAVVCASGVPVTFVGLDVTMQCMFDDADLATLYAAEGAVCRYLADATRAWRNRANDTWKHAMPVLHDPLAVETLVDPTIVETRRGTVSVELCDEKAYARTRFAEGTGPHEVCTTVRGRDAVGLWLRRVTGAEAGQGDA
jgi:purine nucleosidase/pyrimidine-specific ribonucleoside hydrolase